MFDMVKAERFCHIYTGIEDSCVTRVKGLSPLRGVGQSPAYSHQSKQNLKIRHIKNKKRKEDLR